MRKLYNFRKEIRLNGEEWVDTSIYNCIGYCEETECIPQYREITNFAELVEYVNNGKIANAYTEQTFFRKRTVVYLPKKTDLNYPWHITTEKDFKSLEIRTKFEPYSNNLKALAELLPANEFLLYLKDNGITTCPMMK